MKPEEILNKYCDDTEDIYVLKSEVLKAMEEYAAKKVQEALIKHSFDRENEGRMIDLNAIYEWFPDDQFLKADGFDEAVLGVDTSGEPRLIYSVSKCLEILERDMNEDEAIEYFRFNVEGAYMGEQTPIWCWDNM